MSSSFELAGVLWDMDGTLLDTETLSDEAMLLAITDVYSFSPPAHPPSQVDFTWEIKKSIIGTRSAEWSVTIHNWVSTAFPTAQKKDNETLPDRWTFHLNNLCQGDALQPIDGAIALINFFHENKIPQAIATSSTMEVLTHKRSNVRINDAIFNKMDAIVTGDKVSNGKPAPDIYLLAANKLNVDVKNCIVFEDSVAGCQSGRSAGASLVLSLPDRRYEESERIALFSDISNFMCKKGWSEVLEEFTLSNEKIMRFRK
ncbi:hypothetical protein TrLO_g8064 [Triparma laevis f. longispina]|nr:hypothetical protein TrLO_g8064 [Triparma laevis f. longispina]